jgi:hypothetical protein
MTRRIQPLKTLSKTPDYPERPGPADPSRRRFLTRIGLGAGGASILAAAGLPKLAHGQSQEVDFSVLEAHPGRHELRETPAGAPVMPAAPAPPPAPALSATVPPAAQTASPRDAIATITENRALWIEPGYLVLVQWSRPADNTDVIAALEGTTEALAALFSENVSTYENLHDLLQLHILEDQVASLVEAAIAPAELVSLHLDHDCNTVCSGLEPGGGYDDPPRLAGVLPPANWE